MKATAILLVTLGCLLGSLQAQTVPAFISYQGKVADSNGVGLGTGTPINRKVLFRLYDAPTGGIRLWTEEQTTTLADGQFSVLLGNGISPTGSATGESGGAIDAIFTSGTTSRYLEITVDNGDNAITTADLPIVPRQRITSTAYTFRAKVADMANAVNGTATLSSASISGGSFSNGSFSGSGSGLSSLNATNLSSGTVAADRGGAGSVSGILKANGSGTVSAAVAGTDYLSPTGLSFSNITGTLPVSRLSESVLTSNSNINPANLSTIIPNNKLPDNLVRTNVAQTLTETQTIPDILMGSGTGLAKLRLYQNGTDYTTVYGLGVDGDGGGRLTLYIPTPSRRFAFVVGNGTEVMTVTGDGRVGIGTTEPSAPLHVVGSASSTFTMIWNANSGGSAPVGNVSTTNQASIIASGIIRAGTAFHLASDARIKNVVALSDSAADLRTLLGIEISDYIHKDKSVFGGAVSKKLIAQQVEQVFPQAVTKGMGVVPDVYQRAQFKDGWIMLRTTLQKGERVRLITEEGEGVHEVLEVAADGERFRTAFVPKSDKVFVYGREVKDFRTVDYDAISMLNVSATQQIKKEKDAEVKVLQDENKTLSGRVAALEAKDKARDAKLAAIEKALLSADKPAARTVSLLKAAAAK